MENLPFLSILIALPLIGALAILLLARGDEETVARNAKQVALANSTIVFVISLLLWVGFDRADPGFQYVEEYTWIAQYNIAYRVGVDGISVLFVLLSTLLTPLCILSAWDAVKTRVKEYMVAFLVLEALMIGTFVALDLVLFYIFFEAVLIPMFLIIGIWGGPNKIYAAFKFFLYTLLGSLLMLVALIYLYTASEGSFELLDWHQLPLSGTAQTLLFFAFLSAFAVKVPMFPVHTWLPDVHVEAPTGGSAVLAAIMLKLGAYGFLRFSLPIAPDAAHEWAGLMIFLSLAAVIYVGFVTLVQQDMKKLVAYSSVAHMGFVTLGFFIFNGLGVSGGILQMIAHGFVSAAMFLCIGVLYDRVHSREIASYGGVINTMPKFTAFALLFAMANCGLPGTAGFVGEWMVILGAVQYNFWIGLAAASALIFGAAYTLWMFKRVYLGAPANDDVKGLSDIDGREFLVLALLAIAVLYMGIHPKPFTDVMDASVMELLKHVAASKLP